MGYGLITLSVFVLSAGDAVQISNVDAVEAVDAADPSFRGAEHHRLHRKGGKRHRKHRGDSFVEAEKAVTGGRGVGHAEKAVGHSLLEERGSFCDSKGEWHLEWADEFDGDELGQDWSTVQSKKVKVSGDISAPVAGLAVTACRSAECRKENVQVRNGSLHLISERDPDLHSKYYTGAVSTAGRRHWKDDQPYRLCVRAKLPGAQGAEGAGIWPAHWMLPDNELSEKCLDGGEMDIMEMINGDSNAFSTYHWLSSWPEESCGDFNTYHKSRNSMIQLKDYNDQFHEFGVERSGDHITYAVDNRVVHHVPASKLNIKLSHDPFYLIMNTAVGGSWPGEPTSLTRFPTEHVIDYVKVARKAKAADTLTEKQADNDESTMPLGASDGGSNWADHLGGSSLMELGEVHSNSNVFGPPPLSVA